MYPMYGHMDSYPHHRPYAPYNQNLESIPYQMKPDFSKSPSPYEYYPYGINNYYHPHPHPMEFHNCCNHNYFPNYYAFRPPYPHFPPPPPPQPFHFHGSYAPRPHYPMELPPTYDYDKNTPQDHHCCGCLNHSCTQKDDQIVKIKEPDPDAEKKTSDSLVPYPVVWFPPGYLKKEDEKGKPLEVESKGKDRNENSKSFEDGLRLLNGLLPLDMNKLKSLMQDGDEKKVDRKNEDDRRFPFSIFRVPSNPKELKRNSPKGNNLPSNFSITPMNASDTEDSEHVQKNSKKVEKANEKESEGKGKNIPVEFRTDNGERKIANSIEKKLPSSSPPKSSKLPPICLRVDPLPGKKRSSRSPSPTNKGKLENSTSENPKIPVLPNVKDNHQENVHSSKPVEKSKEDDSKNGKCGSAGLTEGKDVTLGQLGDGKCEVGEVKVESETMKEKDDKEENKAVRKVLSDNEAAVIIQSMYRGYEVRKWEPLIKLKQIVKVKDQSAEIKRSIEAFESSSADVKIDDRQRLVIGETIMSLLLKLDTIQGLHPSFRDIRKSVARELVSLQEKLDALTTKKPIEYPSTTTASTTATTTTAATTSTDEAMENGAHEAKEENDEKIPEEALGEEIKIANEPEAVEDVNAKSDDVLEDDGIKAEEENNEKLLEIAQEGRVNNGNEPAVVKDINENVEESSVVEEEATKVDEVEPQIPLIGEENDKLVLEETEAKADVQPEEAQGEDNANDPAVVEDIIGKAEKYPILEEEAMEDEVLPLETEETKVEIPIVGEEKDTKVLEGTKADADVQPEDAQQMEFDVNEEEKAQPNEAMVEVVVQPEEAQCETVDHTKEITGKTEEAEVQLLEGEVQAVGAEELVETQVNKEVNDEFLQPKDDILFKENNEDVGGVIADNVIEQPNSNTKEFVTREIDEKLREENEKLKEMVEKLVEAGKEQLTAISNLSGKVKDLERKLSKKKKLKMRKCARSSRTFDEQMVLNE